MNYAIAAAMPTFTPSADMLFLGGAILCISAAVGFVAGRLYQRGAANRALSRASKQLSRLVKHVDDTLETSRQACAALEGFPNLALSSAQVKQLEAKQSSLLETAARIVSSQRALAEAVAQQRQRQKPAPEEFAIAWQSVDEIPSDDLPDRSAFDANLEMLLAVGESAEVDSGLLFIKIDKYDQLQDRFGAGGASTLFRKLSAAVSRAGRDDDLLCRYSSDTLALLMPQVDRKSGRLLAQKIRDSVRSFHFRLDESGPDVYMTASFGFTLCEPGDNVDLLVNRAGNAVARSQRRGRNQLHLHDGETTVHCLAG